MLLKSGLFFTLFVLTLQARQIGDPQDQGLPGLRDVKYRRFLEASRPIDHTANTKLPHHRNRDKRSAAALSTGVKVCPQETVKAVITSHRAYYKLRVCQEAIWEAFRIFLDRVPNSEEYHTWLHTCQHENLCLDNLALNFSQSQEHLDMVARRVAEHGEMVGTEEPVSDPERECAWTPAIISLPTEGYPNEIPESSEEHIVEFSVTMVDPGYGSHLRADSPQYSEITQELTERMLHIFQKVPGFKEIRVLGFRSEDVSVRCAVVFNGRTELGDGARVLAEPGPQVGENPNGPKLMFIVAEALRRETSLPVDLQTLSFEAVSTIYPADEQDQETVLPVLEEVSTASGDLPTQEAVLQNSLEGFALRPNTPTFTPRIPSVDPEVATATTSGDSSATASSREESVQEGSVGVEVPAAPPLTVVVVEEEEDGELLLEETAPLEETGESEADRAQAEDHVARAPVGLLNNDLDRPADLDTLETSTRRPPRITSTEPLPAETTHSSVDAAEVKIFTTPADNERGMESGVGVSDPAGQAPAPIDGTNAIQEEEEEEEEGGEPVYSGRVTPPLTDHPAAVVPDHREEASANGTEARATGGEEGSGSGFPAQTDESSTESAATPAARQMSTPLATALDLNKELVVFFSLRVTNMMFSEDLFNKNSPEYRSLENTFLELLLPYLQSNLTGFKQLEILNFRNGSVVVNSKMRLDKPVPYNVTQAVHCVLEEFCGAAAKRLDIEIDSRSLDVEPADQADTCKFLACGEFSRCVVNSWSGDAECLCDPGYAAAAGGLPCQSTCTLRPDYCLNDGVCQVIPGHGATCKCPVGKYWHYHGDRCTELVSVPLDPALIATCMVGSLCLVGTVLAVLLFINKKCGQTRKAVTLVPGFAPYAFENTLRENPVFESDEGVLTQVSTLECQSSSSGSSQTQQSPEPDTFASFENIRLSIEIPRQLYTTRTERLVSGMVDFHHCIPHNELYDASKGMTHDQSTWSVSLSEDAATSKFPATDVLSREGPGEGGF